MSEPAANRPLWLPNALVWLRLLLAGVFVALLSGDPLSSPLALFTALLIFIVAAITDFLDGKLARRWNAVTRFGRVMDPFADKILVLAAFICLAGPAFRIAPTPDQAAFQASGVYPWMVVLILARELLVTSLRGLVEGMGGDFSAVLVGKLKMVAQSAAIPVILLLLALGAWGPGNPWQSVIHVAAWLVTVITVASGVPYALRAFGPDASSAKPPRAQNHPESP